MTLFGNMVKNITSPPTNQHWLNHFLGEFPHIPPPNWLKGWAMWLYAMISPIVIDVIVNHHSSTPFPSPLPHQWGRMIPPEQVWMAHIPER